MNIINKEYTSTKKVYVAEDGAEFDYETQCVHYEKVIALKKQWESRKREIIDPEDDCYYFYFIASEEDFEGFLDFISTVEHVYVSKYDKKIYTETKCYMNQWITYKVYDTDDCYSSLYTLNEIKDQITEMQSYCQKAIEQMKVLESEGSVQ